MKAPTPVRHQQKMSEAGVGELLVAVAKRCWKDKGFKTCSPYCVCDLLIDPKDCQRQMEKRFEKGTNAGTGEEIG